MPKIWTSEAENADYMILLARTEPAAPKHRGITYFLVDLHRLDRQPAQQHPRRRGASHVRRDAA